MSGIHLSIFIFILPMGYENWVSKIPKVIALFRALKIFIMDGGLVKLYPPVKYNVILFVLRKAIIFFFILELLPCSLGKYFTI